jgi:two-component system NtrC family sensor kinase
MVDGIVSTIGQRCRRCYSCIRECPVNAICVDEGQAVVIEDRCISCGHCVKVCSQHAKRIASDVQLVVNELLVNENTYAIVAPAFAASFPDTYNKLPSALKMLGFKNVAETAFGADLVSNIYKEHYENNSKKTIISSPCPAIYNFIEKYFVELVPNLAPIVSPMIAMGRYLKTNNENVKVVFIGPCVAKKSEYLDESVEGAIDAVLTFAELKELFDNMKINVEDCEDSQFDPPYASMGKSYSLAGGLLKTAEINSDVLNKDVIVVEGRDKVRDILKDIADGQIHSKFVDILFCEGCISGPAIDSDLNYYSRREKVIEYIDQNLHSIDKNVWKSELFNNRNLNLSRSYVPHSRIRPMPSEEQINEILSRTNKYSKTDELNCGACGYKTCRDYAVAIGKGLAEEDMCLPHLIDKLENAYGELKTTQEQLHNAEKLASIGQLAAGVAHELNNPLGTIMLYSSMLKREIEKGNDTATKTDDLELVLDEAKRCKNIVSNLLNFARQGKIKISTVSISEILNDILRTVNYTKSENEIIHYTDKNEGQIIECDKDQLKQVFINIINNARESMEETPEKEMKITVLKDGNNVLVKIADKGCGISEENSKKLFTPFFTTKKIGKGTGLGLAIAYGIIKMHKGDIRVKSILNEGTTVTVRLPMKLKSNFIEVTS